MESRDSDDMQGPDGGQEVNSSSVCTTSFRTLGGSLEKPVELVSLVVLGPELVYRDLILCAGARLRLDTLARDFQKRGNNQL